MVIFFVLPLERIAMYLYNICLFLDKISKILNLKPLLAIIIPNAIDNSSDIIKLAKLMEKYIKTNWQNIAVSIDYIDLSIPPNNLLIKVTRNKHLGIEIGQKLYKIYVEKLGNSFIILESYDHKHIWKKTPAIVLTISKEK